MTGVASDARAVRRQLLADRDFHRYWSARVISSAGSAATLVAMPVLMYRLTGSGLLTGLITAAESVPYVVFGLIAGAMADRHNRQVMMVVSDLVNGIGLLTIPISFWAGVLTPAQLLIVAAINAISLVFFDAAHLGALVVLVGRARLVSASATIWTYCTATEIGVPALCGVLITRISAAGVMLFDALSFLASACLIRSVARPLRSRQEPGESVSRLASEAIAGLRYLWSNPVLRWVTVIDLVQCIAGGIELGQLVPFASHDLAGGAPQIGLLYMAWGVGGLIASFFCDRTIQRLGAIRAVLYALPLSAASGIGFALTSSWPMAAATLVLWGGFYMVTMLTGLAYRQVMAPEDLQGRVNTTGRMLTWGLGLPLGGLAGGIASITAGPRAAMIASGMLVGAAAIIGWISPLRSALPTKTEHPPRKPRQSSSSLN